LSHPQGGGNGGNGTPIIAKEVADMKSYLKKNNFHYFTLSANSEKPMKASSSSPDSPAEDISNSSEDVDFNVIKVKQMATTRTAPNGQSHMEPLSSLLP
jgi:hypothetical protein